MPTSPQKLAYDRELRAYYRKLGLCPCCSGQEPASPGGKIGPRCREKRKQKIRDHRERMWAAGRCGNCGAPLDRKGPICARCLEKHRQASLLHTIRKKREGRCMQCGRTARPGKTLCQECNEPRLRYGRLKTLEFIERRASCRHESWRVKVKVLDADLAVADQAHVRVLVRQWCRWCRKTETHTIRADTMRFVEVFSWRGRERPCLKPKSS